MNARDKKALTLRVDPELHARLTVEAAARDWSINAFVERLLSESMTRLIPAEEILFVRPSQPAQIGRAATDPKESDRG